MVTLITLVLNPVRPDSLVGRASGIYSVGPGFNPQSDHLSGLTGYGPLCFVSRLCCLVRIMLSHSNYLSSLDVPD